MQASQTFFDVGLVGVNVGVFLHAASVGACCNFRTRRYVCNKLPTCSISCCMVQCGWYHSNMVNSGMCCGPDSSHQRLCIFEKWPLGLWPVIASWQIPVRFAESGLAIVLDAEAVNVRVCRGVRVQQRCVTSITLWRLKKFRTRSRNWLRYCHC